MMQPSRKGVTLVEMMLTVVIFMFVSAGLSAALLAGRSAWLVNENSAIVQQQARNALWVLARDLRQAGGLDIDQGTGSISFSFTHPADGTVTYAWDGTTQQIVRTDSVKHRVIGRNISDLTLTNLGYGVELSLTAYRLSANKKTGALTLKQKVVFR